MWGGGFLFWQGRGHHTPIYWSLVCVRFSLLQVTALVLLVLPEVHQEEGFQVVNGTSDMLSWLTYQAGTYRAVFLSDHTVSFLRSWLVCNLWLLLFCMNSTAALLL